MKEPSKQVKDAAIALLRKTYPEYADVPTPVLLDQLAPQVDRFRAAGTETLRPWQHSVIKHYEIATS